MPRTLNRPRYSTTEARQAEALKSLEVDLQLGPGREELPDDERLLRYFERLTEFYRPANLFQSSFSLFCKFMVWTKDEAAGGRVARMPDWAYLREMDEAFITCNRLFIEKSRRVLASWRACCFDIWVAAGGQDPRWPALMNATGYRSVVIAARKLEDKGGSAEYIDRIVFILEQIEERGLRRLWPEFPTWNAKFGRIDWSNGSDISAIPQGRDQLRGPAATLVHVEEVSFMDQAGPTVESAIPVLRGGGHIILVSTPKAGTWAHRLVKGELRSRRTAGSPVLAEAPRSVPEGRVLSLRTTPDLWSVATVPHTVVPGYDFEATTEGMSQETIRREVLLDWNATGGTLMYPEFNIDVHVAKAPIRYQPDEPLYCCWDPGMTPAFIVTQLNSYGQWCVLASIQPEEGSGLGTYEFGEMCAELLQRTYATPYGKRLEDLRTIHYGDPAGWAPPVKSTMSSLKNDKVSHYDILRNGVEVLIGRDERGDDVYEKKPGWGWTFVGGEMYIGKRVEALRARLSLLIQGQPAFVICPTCVGVKDALLQYHRKERADGRIEDDPEKDWASHGVNALEYGCSRLFVRPEEEDEDMPRRYTSSMAAGRRRR